MSNETEAFSLITQFALINAYKREEALWNREHSQYHDDEKRLSLMTKIATELNTTPDRVDKQIRILRVDYAKSKRLNNNWLWRKELEFLETTVSIFV